MFVPHLQPAGRALANTLATSHPLISHCLAGLLLKRQKTISRTKKERQLRDSAALAHVAPGAELFTKTKVTDSDGSQESSEPGPTPSSVSQTNWQLWELVTGAATITKGGRHCCMSLHAYHLPC